MHLYHDPDVPGRLDIDRGFYERIARATGRRRRVHEHIVPIRSGHAWPVKAGCVVRIVTVEGPQVCYLNLWNVYYSRERLCAARTRQLMCANVTEFDRFWAVLAYSRPQDTSKYYAYL